jgi:hypothetical protein
MILQDPGIKKLLCAGNTFFTSWSWILWLICSTLKYILKINVPNFLMVTSQNFILASCIVGYYIIHVYGYNYTKKIKKLKQVYLDIANIITHVTPFIMIIIFNKFETINSMTDLLLSAIFTGFFCFTYLLINNPQNIYWFTNWKSKKIVSIGIFVYSLLFFVK